ncbi:MAG: YceI family protein [Gammaproteobacteria bacterium]|nr:YceI family protein [Gammaproteobacteria bacterium]
MRQITVSTAAAFAPLCLSAGLAMAQPAAEAPADSQLYEIDAQNSDVHWLVYSAGPAARFGHNHVISVGELTGSVLLSPELEQSQFEIEIPVADLVVDDPDLRAAQEGDQFDSVPDEDDVAGTRRNMLSERVLNAEQHPFLRITGTGPTGAPGEQMLDATIELLGRSIPVSLPTEVSVDGDAIEASGTFRLTHEMLGMEPFSVMMGALQVGEPLDFSYRITARRAD